MVTCFPSCSPSRSRRAAAVVVTGLRRPQLPRGSQASCWKMSPPSMRCGAHRIQKAKVMVKMVHSSEPLRGDVQGGAVLERRLPAPAELLSRTGESVSLSGPNYSCIKPEGRGGPLLYTCAPVPVKLILPWCLAQLSYIVLIVHLYILSPSGICSSWSARK